MRLDIIVIIIIWRDPNLKISPVRGHVRRLPEQQKPDASKKCYSGIKGVHFRFPDFPDCVCMFLKMTCK